MKVLKSIIVLKIVQQVSLETEGGLKNQTWK